MEEKLASQFQLLCREDGILIDPADFSWLLGEYYSAQGWDFEMGWLTEKLLERLGFEMANPEPERLSREERVNEHYSSCVR